MNQRGDFDLKNGKYKIGGQIILISQDEIYPNPNQPRRKFDFDELESLAQSIRQNGIIQPITVRVNSRGEYELISGERRLRAARLVGITKVPCILNDISESDSAVFAIIENLQRQNLDFFEEAEALATLVSDYRMSQDELCKKLGKAQSTLSNKLRLLKLDKNLLPYVFCQYLTKHPLDMGELLDVLGLTDYQNKFPSQLSGGQQQRCAIARALIKNPKLLLCDEPTGALDSTTSRSILMLLEEVNKTYGTTMLIVTHNNAIRRMVHQVIEIRDGMISGEYINDVLVPAADLTDL